MQFKWLTIPREAQRVQAVQMWEVRWHSRHGEYIRSTRPELECFPSKEEAENFAEALRAAFQLIRMTSGTGVSVSRAK